MTKKSRIVFLFSILAFIVLSVFVLADSDKSNKPELSFLPDKAVQVSENVFSLGKSVDHTGKVVEGFLFIHDKKQNAKPPFAGGGNGGEEKCYAFMASGAKWKSIEDYLVDPSNSVGLDETFIRNDLNSDMQKWEISSGKNIFGSEAVGIVDGDDSVSPDNKNEVLFKNLGQTNTIAYTIVWGIFYGNPKSRELVEWDMVFNEDFPWSSTGEAGKMDFENIAVHEIGHAAGMSHPTNTCTEETMYAYADFGETKKRDLNQGDIKGIIELYK